MANQFFLIWLVFVALILAVSVLRNRKIRSSVPGASRKDKDLPATVTRGRIGDTHQDVINGSEHRVTHEKPELGYVILNGVKYKLEDCKDL